MPAVSVLDSASTEIVAIDYNRTLVVISNSHATSKLHVAFGAAATTNDAYIPAGGSLTVTGERFKAAINGISSSGTITANYSKFSGGS